MSKKQVLIIEDDSAIREGVVDALAFSGYQTLEAGCGEKGAEMALGFSYDLLLLDLTLPKRDGLSILKELRVSRPTTPVIIMTAKGAEDDRIKGLSLGADDYVVKPFSVKELLARIAAVLRRSPERPSDVKTINFTGGVVDLEKGEISYDDNTKEILSEREAMLIRYLAVNQGRPVSRAEILARVWQIDVGNIETRTIDMHIARLREKLRDNKGQIIRTVRGKGYMFTGEGK